MVQQPPPRSPDQLLAAALECERRGEPAEAERCYRRILSIEPDHAQALAQLGFLAISTGRPEAATALIARAKLLAPGLARGYAAAGERLAGERRWAEAAGAWQRNLALEPGDAAGLIGLAEALQALGHGPAAAARAAEAAAGATEPALLGRAARVLHETERLDEAARVLTAALKASPSSAPLHLRLGQVLRDQGRLEEAAEALRRSLALDPGSAEAWLHLAELQRFSRGDHAIDRMEALLARLGERGAGAAPLLFALGKAYDDAGEVDRAFDRLQRGNKVMAERLGYDPARDEAWAARIVATFDAALLARLAGAGDPSELPLLILGMPRSGSTLAEQILASHPKVHGAGEIAEVGRMLEDLARLEPGGGDYLEACRRARPASFTAIGSASVRRLAALGGQKTRVTNKTPGNVFHAGFVHLALPAARFIETRRDAMETCFACYRVLFRQGVAFSYDLAHLGRYYRVYHRLVEHWRALLAERFFTLSYETLIADQEAVSRGLVQFAGLPWDAACLAFYENRRPVLTASGAQVRQPLAAAPVARWRRYEKHLSPLIEALGPLAG